MSTSTRRVEKTVLFIAEKRCWSGSPWHYMTGVRPNPEKDRVAEDLQKYVDKRSACTNGAEYRVIEYVRNNRAGPVEISRVCKSG